MATERVDRLAANTTAPFERRFAGPGLELDVARAAALGEHVVGHPEDRRRQIFGTLAQRRQDQIEPRQLVKQIVAEAAGGDLGGEIPVGERDHAS